MATITPITIPFANSRVDNVIPSLVQSNVVANQLDGFPIFQALDPVDPDYTPVQETEMNGILNFYTNLLYQQGKGLQYTFNQALSNAINGYPLGAILWCESNNTFQRSLINNNTRNFVANPAFINDKINWINQNDPTPYFPDFIDIISTGDVAIGGRIAGSKNSLTTLSKNYLGYIAKVSTSDSLYASTYVGNNMIQGGNTTGLMSITGGLNYVEVSNSTTIGDGSSAYAGRAYYAKQGTQLYPAVSNLVQKFNPTTSYTSTSGIQTYPDANGNYVTDIINDKEGVTCGIQMSWNSNYNYWNRPQLVGQLSQQWISANPTIHPTPNAIYTLGDFRNGFIFLDLGNLFFLMIRASWQGELWYCTLSGHIQIYPGTGEPANTRYSYDINLYNMFHISGIRPNDSPQPFIGVANRTLYGPVPDRLGGAGVQITDTKEPNIITPFLQFDNVPGGKNLQCSFICQFSCTTIGNF